MSKDSIKSLIDVYTSINEYQKCANEEQIFSPTIKSISAINSLEIPKDKTSFEKLVKNLYILIYEGSGDSKRLNLRIDESGIIKNLRELRQHFEHDREHGKISKVKKKYLRIGTIFEILIGKKYPTKKEDWTTAGNVLIEKLELFLQEFLESLENPPEKNEASLQQLEIFYEHEITLFPKGKEKMRKAIKSKKLHFSDAVCFLPSFRYSFPPEFGKTRSAVYITSEAPRADFKGFVSFLREIETKWMEWNEKGTAHFIPDSKLMSWSINTEDQILYGSGCKNLIDALAKSHQNIRALLSIVLQGEYGDDVPETSFIVIGSDIKGGFFNYNFIDFYLSSVPIEWDWIRSFNDSLDKLSSFNRKASSYRLKRYYYYAWESEEEIQIRNGIIGGIGRNGLENKKWHSFEGLILNKADLDAKYILNEEDSWKASYADFSCPKNYLEEFLVRFTNPIPSYEEIQKGELVGIMRPRIYLFGFEGRGWTILAIGIHGISIMKQDSLI